MSSFQAVPRLFSVGSSSSSSSWRLDASVHGSDGRSSMSMDEDEGRGTLSSEGGGKTAMRLLEEELLPGLPHPTSSSTDAATTSSRPTLQRSTTQGTGMYGAFRPMALPSVPDPVNGMIRTYDNKDRTFSRPYSAKTVFFYKDGDEHFTGVRLPISKSRYRTIDSLLDDLNSTLYMPFGVRRLTTPMGRTNIEDLDQLKHMGKYVATSSKFPRGIDLSALERIAKARQQAHAKLARQTDGGQSYWVPTSPSYKTKLRMSRSLGLNFVPSKQMFFVLSGDTKMYRTLLNPARLPSMENLLHEISEGLGIAVFRLYTVDGARIFHVNELVNLSPPKALAVQRNGRPIVSDQPRFTLPPIGGPSTARSNATTKTPRSKTTLTSLTASSSNASSLANGDNQIEKPRTSIRKNTRRTTGLLKRLPRGVPGAPTKAKKKGAAAAATAAAAGAIGAVVLPKIGGSKGRKNEDADSGKATSSGNSSRGGSRRPVDIEEDSASSDYPDSSHPSAGKHSKAHVEAIGEEMADHASEPDYVQDDDESIDMTKVEERRRSQMQRNMSMHDAYESEPESEQPDTEEEEERREEEEERGEEEAPRRHSSFTPRDASPRPNGKIEDEEESLDDGPENNSDEEPERMEQEEEEAQSHHEEGARTSRASSKEESVRTTSRSEMRAASRHSTKAETRGHVEVEDEEYTQISHTPRPINMASPISMGRQISTDEDDDEDCEEEREGEEEEGRPLTRASAKNEAATTIQKHVRGYQTRKKKKKRAPAPPPVASRPGTAQSDVSSAESEQPDGEDDRDLSGLDAIAEEDEDTARYSTPHHAAAIVIQRHVRGYQTRKRYKAGELGYNSKMLVLPAEEEGEKEEEAPANGGPDIEEVHPPSRSRSTQSDPMPMADDMPAELAYTAIVTTGNRWSADSEADLFIILHGTLGESPKIQLDENEHSSRWLQTRGARFRQNTRDSFHFTLPNLGVIESITLGHTKQGYGAGIFIDQVIINENIVSGRQFLFQTKQWFDSHQVDGKLERSIPLLAYYVINRVTEMQSQNRWQLRLFTGNADGTGGTTSALRIVGYGTTGFGIADIAPDKELAKTPSSSMIQVDFGDIGELVKIRLEIDGEGASPALFLQGVELEDLDTEEQTFVNVNDWLDCTGAASGSQFPQPFREIVVFRADTDLSHTHVMTYEGSIGVGDMSMVKGAKLEAQLIGELGTSGVFPIFLNEGSTEYQYSVDAVYLGRIQKVNVFGQMEAIGEDVFVGLGVLQDIYERRQLGSIPVGEELFARTARVSESRHHPYQYECSVEHVQREDELIAEQSKRLADRRRFYKTLSIRGIIDAPTKRPLTKDETPPEDEWILSLSAETDPGPALAISLIVGQKTYPMERVEGEAEETDDKFHVLRYTLKHKPPLGMLDKIRIALDPLADGIEAKIHKMRLENAASLAQLRFPRVDSSLDAGAVVEISSVYPDVAPEHNVIYVVSVETESSSGVFSPLFELVGDKTSTGLRPLNRINRIDMSSGARDQFELDAVKIGTMEKFRVRLVGEGEASWSGRIAIAPSNDEFGVWKTTTIHLDAPNKTKAAKLKRRDTRRASAKSHSSRGETGMEEIDVD